MNTKSKSRHSLGGALKTDSGTIVNERRIWSIHIRQEYLELKPAYGYPLPRVGQRMTVTDGLQEQLVKVTAVNEAKNCFDAKAIENENPTGQNCSKPVPTPHGV